MLKNIIGFGPFGAAFYSNPYHHPVFELHDDMKELIVFDANVHLATNVALLTLLSDGEGAVAYQVTEPCLINFAHEAADKIEEGKKILPARLIFTKTSNGRLKIDKVESFDD